MLLLFFVIKYLYLLRTYFTLKDAAVFVKNLLSFKHKDSSSTLTISRWVLENTEGQYLKKTCMSCCFSAMWLQIPFECCALVYEEKLVKLGLEKNITQPLYALSSSSCTKPTKKRDSVNLKSVEEILSSTCTTLLRTRDPIHYNMLTRVQVKDSDLSMIAIKWPLSLL